MSFGELGPLERNRGVGRQAGGSQKDRGKVNDEREDVADSITGTVWGCGDPSSELPSPSVSQTCP